VVLIFTYCKTVVAGNFQTVAVVLEHEPFIIHGKASVVSLVCSVSNFFHIASYLKLYAMRINSNVDKGLAVFFAESKLVMFIVLLCLLFMSFM